MLTINCLELLILRTKVKDRVSPHQSQARTVTYLLFYVISLIAAPCPCMAPPLRLVRCK